MNYIITITLSIITAFLTTWLTSYFSSKQTKKEKRTRVVEKLYGYRYQISPEYQSDGTKEINYYIGLIPIIFSDNQAVLKEYRNFKKIGRGSALTKMLEKMCQDKYVDIDISNFDDDLITSVMGVKK